MQRAVREAGWWLLANALAWMLGMPIVFLGASTIGSGASGLGQLAPIWLWSLQGRWWALYTGGRWCGSSAATLPEALLAPQGGYVHKQEVCHCSWLYLRMPKPATTYRLPSGATRSARIVAGISRWEMRPG